MTDKPEKVDQETTENDPKKSVLGEGSDSLTQRFHYTGDPGVFAEDLEDPTTLKNWEVFPLTFEFTGKAREFFGIWLSNLLLSILTIGIYSAWASS